MLRSKIAYWIVKLFHSSALILNNLLHHYIKHVCQNGGDILEIGFGAGVTANMIQTYNVKTHTIIERDDYFFNKLSNWAKNKPNVIVIHGDWVKDIPTDKKYDGIFIDLWNSDEDYGRKRTLCEELDNHIKPGTVFLSPTHNILDEHLYTQKGHKYEEIKINRPPVKSYNILSKIIRKHSKENEDTIRHLDSVFKVTYK
tara:strand:+ start:374 stop:970 length:597 start_codon:yes stop_codon:yes gene_type:complete